MKGEQISITQKKDISLVNRFKQHLNHKISSQPNNQQTNSLKISLRNNLNKKSYKAPIIDQNEVNKHKLDN